MNETNETVFVTVREKRPCWIAEDCNKRLPDGAYFSSTGNLVLDNNNGRVLILKPGTVVLTSLENGHRALIEKAEFEAAYEVVTQKAGV